jgi:hypothetical protein
LAAGWSHHAQAAMKIHMPIDKLTGLPADQSPPPQPPKPLLPDPNAKSTTFLRAQQQCGFPKSRPYHPMYRDLTGLTLFVYVPFLFTGSEKCLGREEECISESRFGSEGDRKKALNDLLLRTKAYRPPIHLDNLVKMFSDVLRQELMPYVLPDQNCKAADLVVVTNARDVKPYEFAPNVLTVRVELTIMHDTEPPIAVLTVGTHRLDPTQRNLWDSITGESTAIPLDLTNEQISARIKYFAQSSLAIYDEGFTKE